MTNASPTLAASTQLTLYEKKMLLHSRLRTGILGLLLVLLVLSAAYLSSRLSAVCAMAEEVRQMAEEVCDTLDSFDVQQIEIAVSSLTEATDNLAGIDISSLNSTVSALQEAADTLAEVDMGSLNTAVTALTDAADNLASLDIDSLNSLVSSLETVATKLENVTSTLSKLFNR